MDNQQDYDNDGCSEEQQNDDQQQKGKREDIRHTHCIVFTNCYPNFTTKQLQILVSHALDIPYIFKEDNIVYELTKQQEKKPVTEMIPTVYKIRKVLFKLKNYEKYDQVLKKQVVLQDIYQTKVAFVELNKILEEEQLQKIQILIDRENNRTIFGSNQLNLQVDRSKSLYCQGIQLKTNLQQLYDYINSQLQQLDKTNKITNIKTFVKNNQIQGSLYISFKQKVDQLLLKKLLDKAIEIPNKVQIYECLDQDQGKKFTQHYQNVRNFKKEGVLKNKERSQTQMVFKSQKDRRSFFQQKNKKEQ